MMSDSIDDALDNDEAEDETDELTNQVGLTYFSFICPFYIRYIFNDKVTVTVVNTQLKLLYNSTLIKYLLCNHIEPPKVN